MRLCLIGRTNLRNCCVVGCVFVAAFCVVFVLVWIAGRALWQRLTFAAGATFLPPRPVLQGQRPAGPSAHNCCTYLHKCFSWLLHSPCLCSAAAKLSPPAKHWKLLPSEILPGLGSLTIYIFRLSGWLFLQKWERKSWKKNETVAQISGRRCMTLGVVWPSFPDEGGAVQLSTLGGRRGKSR